MAAHNPKVLDPRAQRTRQALRRAVIALIPVVVENDGEISISEIVKEAGVNRSSFYVHYKDVDDLLADAFDELAVQVNQLNMISPGVSHDNLTGLPKTMLQYLTHIAEYQQAYTWVLGPRGSGAVIHRLRLRFQEMIKQSLVQYADRRNANLVGFDADAAYMAGGIIGTISIWLSEAPTAPAGQVASWVWRQLQADFFRAMEQYSMTNRHMPQSAVKRPAMARQARHF